MTSRNLNNRLQVNLRVLQTNKAVKMASRAKVAINKAMASKVNRSHRVNSKAKVEKGAAAARARTLLETSILRAMAIPHSMPRQTRQVAPRKVSPPVQALKAANHRLALDSKQVAVSNRLAAQARSTVTAAKVAPCRLAPVALAAQEQA